MSTFNRADYIRLFGLASSSWEDSRRSGQYAQRQRERWSQIMDMCEGVLGQLHRPDRELHAKAVAELYKKEPSI